MDTQLTTTTSADGGIEQIEQSVKLALARADAEERIFKLEQRRMIPYAESTLVPAHYRNNIGNCMIAAEMARRIGANTLSVMQNLYIVHGNPGWSAKFAISIFNTCGRFTAIKYRFDGCGEEYGCTAYATEKASGEVVESPKITWKLVKAEGWLNKPGSKWKTMPELMFRYRAAAYLVATTAPELLNGMRTAEEYEDMYGMGAPAEAPAEKATKRGIAAKIESAKVIAPESVSEPAPEPQPSQEPEDLAEQVRKQIEADRAAAIKKAHERKNDLGIIIEGTTTAGDCRPD